MALDAVVRARVDKNLKEDVESILSEIGLNTSQAINIFLKRVKLENGIPFELKIPNKETLKAIEEAKNRVGESLTLEEFLKESELNANSL